MHLNDQKRQKDYSDYREDETVSKGILKGETSSLQALSCPEQDAGLELSHLWQKKAPQVCGLLVEPLLNVARVLQQGDIFEMHGQAFFQMVGSDGGPERTAQKAQIVHEADSLSCFIAQLAEG